MTATRKAFLGELLLLISLAVLIRSVKAVNKCNIKVSVFLNASDTYQDFVFKSAEKLVHSRNSASKNSSSKSSITLHLSKTDLANISRGVDGLEGAFPRIWNISSNFQGAIFMDITSENMFFSTILENCRIPTIGLFQSEAGAPTTQESSTGFTRVAAPSVVEYAVAMAKILQKMGWRSLCLVVTADYEGKVFADAVRHLATKEKWRLLATFWVRGDENDTVKSARLREVLFANADVILGHLREKSNDEMFRSIINLQTMNNNSAWLVTDVTTYGIQDIYSLPVGLIKVSWKAYEIGHDFDLYVNALDDAVALLENAFENSVSEEEGLNCSALKRSRSFQEKVVRYLGQLHIDGCSSLFKGRPLSDEAQGVYNIWNLKLDLDDRKHWSPVGLGTPSGLALEPLLVSNGDILSPLLYPKRPVLRVPVVEWPPLVQAKSPVIQNSLNKSCVGKALPCYKYLNSSQQGKQLLCCFGASIDCLKFLQRDLGFDVEIYLTPDQQYGTFNATTGSFNGLVNELLSGRGDLAIDLSLSMRRANIVDMVYPSIPLALNILVAKEQSYSDQATSWFSWLAPFEYDLWLAILGTCNVILLVVWWLDRKSPKGYYHILKDSDEDAFTLLDSMSYVWGVAFGKDIGAEKTPRSNSARLVSAVYAFLALIIVNTYCANLMAFLVQDSVDLPITGIRDAKLIDKSLSPPDGFRLGITQGTSEEAYFKNHSDAVFRKIYHVNLKIHLISSFEEGIKQFKDGKLDGFVADYLSLRQAAFQDHCCLYSLAGPNFFHFGYSFAFPKGSPWTEAASLSVLKNQENNSIQAILDYWFDKQKCTTTTPNQLEYQKFFGLFLLLGSVIGFCFIALVSEMLIIFLLIKFGRHLGPIGKSMKRMIFSVRKGEENDVYVTWLQLYKHHKSLRPSAMVSAISPGTIRRASFYNLSFDECGDVSRSEQLLNVNNLTAETSIENGHHKAEEL